MREILSDDQIARLIRERKELPPNWQVRLRLKPRAEISQKRSSLIVVSVSGVFRIMIRQSTIQFQDFSVILGFRRSNASDWFRLRRYNGPHPPRGEHKNRIERQIIRGFHIHLATQRYQERGFDPDGFAQPSKLFRDNQSALELMFTECAFEKPTANESGPDQQDLFPRS